MKQRATTDFSPLNDINSAADFYGWKEKIVTAMQGKDVDLAHRLKYTDSLMDFFMMKDVIISKLCE